MARPLSEDLRERIVRAVEGGLSRRLAAKQFQVSESCAIKLLQRWERTGSVAPAPMGARKPFALAAYEGLVRALLAAQPDLTLDEWRARLAAEGVEVGRSSIDRYLKALGLTRKKRRSTRPSRRGRTSPPHASPGGAASES
jgi:putative transposase